MKTNNNTEQGILFTMSQDNQIVIMKKGKGYHIIEIDEYFPVLESTFGAFDVNLIKGRDIGEISLIAIVKALTDNNYKIVSEDNNAIKMCEKMDVGVMRCEEFKKVIKI